MKLFRNLTVACLAGLLGLTILLSACNGDAVQSSGEDTTAGTSATLLTPAQTTPAVTDLPQTVPVTTPAVTTVPVTTPSVTTTVPVTAPDVPDVTDPPKDPDVTTPTPPETEPTPEVCRHEYAVTVEDATCTAEGKKVYTCTTCGDSYSETIAKIAHSFANATCTTPKTCTSCGLTEGKASGHSHKLTSTTNATCTAEGKKVYT